MERPIHLAQLASLEARCIVATSFSAAGLALDFLQRSLRGLKL